MSFQIAVVAHMNRLQEAEKLAGDVNADYMAIDDGSLGAGGNHRRAWEWLQHQYFEEEADAQWSVVLEDDAVPVPGFLEQLNKALYVAPTPVVSLYLGRGRPAQNQVQRALGMISTDQVDPHWLVSPHMLHHVGVAIRSDQLDSLCDYLPWHLRSQMPIDEIVSRWAKRGPRCQVSYTWPSLVDHNADLPSVIGPHRISFIEQELLFGMVDDRTKDDPRLKRVAWRTGTREKWNSLSFPF